MLFVWQVSFVSIAPDFQECHNKTDASEPSRKDTPSPSRDAKIGVEFVETSVYCGDGNDKQTPTKALMNSVDN